MLPAHCRTCILSLGRVIRRPLLSTCLILLFVSISSAQQAYEQQIQLMSSTLSQSIRKANKKNVAVVDFTNLQGEVTELGRFLAEEFSVALFSDTAGFEVIDRTHLKTLLKEHNLSATGLIDPSTAKQLGQIAGADVLVTGNITPLGESVRLSIKALGTESAKMIGAVNGDIPNTAAITELLDRGVGEVASRPSSPSPSSSSTTSKVASQVQEVEQGGFLLTLTDCHRSRTGILFELTVVNTSQSGLVVSLFLGCRAPFGGSYVVDDLGNQYGISKIMLGAREDACPTDFLYTGTRARLEPGLPIKARVTSSGIPEGAQRISLVLSGGGSTRFVFKDIPIIGMR